MGVLTGRDRPAPILGRACYRCGRELTAGEVLFCTGCQSPIPILIPAHAGAGVSALAAATGFIDTDPAAVMQDQRVQVREIAIANIARHPRRIGLLVARTHHAGLQAARETLAAERDSGRVTRLLLVPDAPGKLPKPLADQIRVIAGARPVTLTPWVEVWRWAPGTTTETFTRFLPSMCTSLTTDRP